MKKYVFEVVIKEGNNEYWEGLLENGVTGCDELLTQMGDALAEAGFEAEIKLIKFEDR